MSPYIFMVHVTKELDFSQCSLSINDIVKRVTDLLDGNLFMSIRIHSSTKKKNHSQQTNIKFMKSQDQNSMKN